jgi:hypothetical protein
MKKDQDEKDINTKVTVSVDELIDDNDNITIDNLIDNIDSLGSDDVIESNSK